MEERQLCTEDLHLIILTQLFCHLLDDFQIQVKNLFSVLLGCKNFFINWNFPEVSGIPNQNFPEVSRFPNRNFPEVSGIPNQNFPKVSRIPNQIVFFWFFLTF